MSQNSIKATVISAMSQYMTEMMQSDLSKEQKNANVDAVTRYIEVLNKALEPQLEQMAADKKLLAEVATRLTRIVG